MKMALDCLACSIILCHNHPSGNLIPSEADKEITRKIKEAGKLLDIAVLDHVIIGNNAYFSFADEGLI
jgi:DNA repair protein RadC